MKRLKMGKRRRRKIKRRQTGQIAKEENSASKGAAFAATFAIIGLQFFGEVPKIRNDILGVRCSPSL